MIILFIVGVSVVSVMVHVYVYQSCRRRGCVKVNVQAQQHSPPCAVGLTFAVGLAVMLAAMLESAVYPLVTYCQLLWQPSCA